MSEEDRPFKHLILENNECITMAFIYGYLRATNAMYPNDNITGLLRMIEQDTAQPELEKE